MTKCGRSKSSARGGVRGGPFGQRQRAINRLRCGRAPARRRNTTPLRGARAPPVEAPRSHSPACGCSSSVSPRARCCHSGWMRSAMRIGSSRRGSRATCSCRSRRGPGRSARAGPRAARPVHRSRRRACAGRRGRGAVSSPVMAPSRSCCAAPQPRGRGTAAAYAAAAPSSSALAGRGRRPARSARVVSAAAAATVAASAMGPPSTTTAMRAAVSRGVCGAHRPIVSAPSGRMSNSSRVPCIGDIQRARRRPVSRSARRSASGRGRP